MANGQDWWQGLNNFLQQFGRPPAQTYQRPTPQTQVQAPQPAPSQEQGDVMGIIVQSAKTHRLAMMLYNGNWRYIEPYSYRHFSTGMHLMAFCHRHQNIESFKPGKVEAIQLTEMPFKPRWPIEIGMD